LIDRKPIGGATTSSFPLAQGGVPVGREMNFLNSLLGWRFGRKSSFPRLHNALHYGNEAVSGFDLSLSVLGA
jgi:hypothetical protein